MSSNVAMETSNHRNEMLGILAGAVIGAGLIFRKNKVSIY